MPQVVDLYNREHVRQRLHIRRLIIAVVIGIISEVMPIPGALAAALVFPEGIHSDHPIGYLVLALLTNLLLFTFLAYFVMAVIVQIRSSTR